MRASTIVAILSLAAEVVLSVALPLPASKFERAGGSNAGGSNQRKRPGETPDETPGVTPKRPWRPTDPSKPLFTYQPLPPRPALPAHVPPSAGSPLQSPSGSSLHQQPQPHTTPILQQQHHAALPQPPPSPPQPPPAAPPQPPPKPQLINPNLFQTQTPQSESRPPLQYINPAWLHKKPPGTRRHSPRPGHPAARAYVRELLTTSIDDLD